MAVQSPRAERDRELAGVEGNRRLTTLTAIVLLALLAVEGLTVLAGVRSTLSVHVFVGMLLLPPIALKLASVGYRFVRYYTGSTPYRTAGPPPWFLRALGPVVVVSTVALFGSGVALIVLGPGTGSVLAVHKISFIVWGISTSAHVLAHLRRLPGVATTEWLRRRRPRGATVRLVALAASLVLGLGIAGSTIHLASPWAHHHHFGDRFGQR